MKFIQARHYRQGRIRPVRLLVVHDMEAPEKTTTAEAVARYFAARNTRPASAHYCFDSDSEVQCVRDSDTAYAAKGANADGIHYELAGYARQSAQQWLDPFGRAMLARVARVAARHATAYGIPVRKLSAREVAAGAKGFCGHADVTAAFPPGTGHTDPGGGFPWAYFLDLVRAQLGEPTTVDEEDLSIMDAATKKYLDEQFADVKAENKQHIETVLRGKDHPNLGKLLDLLTRIAKKVGA